MNKRKVSLCLYNIRSVHNVGSIFRTADASSVSEIFLVGTSPTPIDRFGRWRSDIAKVALGAEKAIRYTYFKNWSDFHTHAIKEKIKLIALEQNKNAVDYKKAKVPNNFCLIVGEEVSGIPEEILENVSQIVEIKMLGEKESLNVSVATGVALFRLLNI